MNLNKHQNSSEINSVGNPGNSSNITHLHYKCFPSSTALSNDLVTVAVRSFHSSKLQPLRCDGSRWTKKSSLDDDGVQLCVSAQALGIGSVPLHSSFVDSTASSPLRHSIFDSDNNTKSTENESSSDRSTRPFEPTIDMFHPSGRYSQFPRSHLSCSWDSNVKQSDVKQQQSSNPMVGCQEKNILTLPVRYKDLSHDACIRFEIQTSRNKKIGTATLNLWDDENRLKSGLQKLKVNLSGIRAQGQSTTSDSMVKKPTDMKTDEKFANDNNNNEILKDEKWEAFLVLRKIQEMQNLAKAKKGLPTAGNASSKQQNQQEKQPGQVQLEDFNITTNGLSNRHSIQSAPWLDNLTTKQCVEVLRAQNNAGRHARFHTKKDEEGDLSNLGDACLIVELNSCDFPILHHEQSYGNTLYGGASSDKNVGSSSDGVGSSNANTNTSSIGSITPIDISLYHHEFTRIEKNNIFHEELNKYFIRMPDPVHALNESQEMGLKLVQVLDFESVDDNPVEDKYRTLQHELLRGLVDPALKPDAHERSQLNTIINGTSQHLSREEKDLLWRFRFSLVDNRRALTKFLLAVEWTVESEVIQAAELLEQWRKRSPIEVSDALKLLGRNVAFQTGLVRAYAIDTLELADDGELVLYLLQLVQALKYEINVDEHTGINNLKQIRGGMNEKKDFKENISLASFLIERSSKNIELANYLYWYLKVELDDPIYGQRYKKVFLQMKNKLSGIPFKSKESSTQHFTPLSSVLDSVSKIGAGNTKSIPSMWNILETQSEFISNVIECQLESRLARGRKEVKEKRLRETLQEKGCHRLHNGAAVLLPSAPHIWVTGVKAQTARMFKSALYPALIEFFVDRGSSFQSADDDENIKTYRVMVKTGDDLRQDQLVIMMIKLMDRILKRGTLDLCLKPYPILAMPDKTGLVEFVPNSMAISQVLAENNNSILHFFQKVAPSKDGKYGVDPQVMQTYIRSCAGYCVITYIIGVGDRHLDNIMLQRSGELFHIDFGFIFGRDPKPLPPAFRLTREMVDGMGGQESQEYQQFCKFACQAYNLLRKRAGLVLNLLHLMSDAGIEDLSSNPSYDAEGVIGEVEKRFQLELTDEQAEAFFLQQIKDCLSAIAPRVMDVFHQISVARR